MRKTCETCRFAYSKEHIPKPCRYCKGGFNSRVERVDLTGWKPMTEAQILERKLELNTSYGKKLTGDITKGYTYIDTDMFIDPNKLKEEENKNMPTKEYIEILRRQLYIDNPKQFIKDVIFNDPATIVFWNDGTKTIVKANGETFDPEKGLAMVISKKFLGNQGNYFEVFKKWLPKQNDQKEIDKPIFPPSRVKELILTPAEFAERIGCTERTIQKHCREGLYPGAKKVGGKWKIPYVED